jgi:hypothetical protein
MMRCAEGCNLSKIPKIRSVLRDPDDANVSKCELSDKNASRAELGGPQRKGASFATSDVRSSEKDTWEHGIRCAIMWTQEAVFLGSASHLPALQTSKFRSRRLFSAGFMHVVSLSRPC